MAAQTTAVKMDTKAYLETIVRAGMHYRGHYMHYGACPQTAEAPYVTIDVPCSEIH